MTSSHPTQIDIMGMDVKKGPTPEQWTEIERVSKAFDNDWMLDPLKRQIRRKDRSWFRAIRDRIWPRRHTVFSMYWWLKLLFGGKFGENKRIDYMAFTFPLNHDNMPIQGYPVKYELVAWTIPKQDLCYLTHGPLINKSDGELLVFDKTKWEGLAKKWATLSRPVKFVLWIMGAILTIASFYKLVLALWF